MVTNVCTNEADVRAAFPDLPVELFQQAGRARIRLPDTTKLVEFSGTSDGVERSGLAEVFVKNWGPGGAPMEVGAWLGSHIVMIGVNDDGSDGEQYPNWYKNIGSGGDWTPDPEDPTVYVRGVNRFITVPEGHSVTLRTGEGDTEVGPGEKICFDSQGGLYHWSIEKYGKFVDKGGQHLGNEE